MREIISFTALEPLRKAGRISHGYENTVTRIIMGMVILLNVRYTDPEVCFLSLPLDFGACKCGCFVAPLLVLAKMEAGAFSVFISSPPDADMGSTFRFRLRPFFAAFPMTMGTNIIAAQTIIRSMPYLKKNWGPPEISVGTFKTERNTNIQPKVVFVAATRAA